MGWIAIYATATGEIEQVTRCDAALMDMAGRDWLAVPDELAGQPIEVVDGEVVPCLATLRERRWATVKARRDHAEWAGCETPLGRVDTDPDSQRKVSGSVQMAMIAQGSGAPFNVPWTMQDNRVVPHDAAAMIAMGLAVGAHVAACHAVAVGLRASIDAADSAEAIEAIDIEADWPA